MFFETPPATGRVTAARLPVFSSGHPVVMRVDGGFRRLGLDVAGGLFNSTLQVVIHDNRATPEHFPRGLPLWVDAGEREGAHRRRLPVRRQGRRRDHGDRLSRLRVRVGRGES